MKELLQRLSTLDEDASAALKIVIFFDTLMSRSPGLEPFVRGAAVLAGHPAGFAHPRHQLWLRVDASGRALPPLTDPELAKKWPHKEFDDGSGALVWVESPGGHAQHTGLLLERMAAGLQITIERVSPLELSDDAGAVEVLLSRTSTSDARRKAARRLRLRENEQVRTLATPICDAAPPGYRSAVTATAYGQVRLSIDTGTDHPPAARVGVGSRVALAELATSWEQALLALRLSSRLSPCVQWEDLGALAVLAAAADGSVCTHPDVTAVELMAREAWGLDTLDALAAADSSRAAAQLLGLHHSTVQARQAQAEETLGFKVSTATGRTRLAAALILHRLGTATFDQP